MMLSVFSNLHAQECSPRAISWPELAAYLAAPQEYPSKHDAPLLKMAAFGSAKSKKGSLRHDANVVALHGIEGDHDAGTMSPEEAVNRLAAARILGLIYTSASHTPEKPRWRVLVPLSQSYEPSAHRELVGRLNAYLGGTLSGESFTLSQSYYFGRVTGVPYACYASPGGHLDLSPIVPVFPAFAANDLRGDYTLSDAPCEGWNGPTDDVDLIRRALQSRSASNAFGAGSCFADLWDCNTEVLERVYPDGAGGYDASGADAALVNHLSFWTGQHGTRIEALMWQSKLVREKWEREDYLPRTIAQMLSKPGDFIIDKPLAESSAPAAVADAPQQTRVVGKTFLSVEDQLEHFKGCVYVVQDGKVLVPDGRLLDEKRFRVVYGGFAFAMDTANERTTRNAWEAFTESNALRAQHVAATCFRPDLPPVSIVLESGLRLINTWVPPNVHRVAGDAGPFQAHLEKVLPNAQDRRIFLSYMAACVQYPGTKFTWMPVLQGCEGNGKSFFSECVEYAVGPQYTHWVAAGSEIGSRFNAFLAKSIFLAIDEMYARDHATLDVLKTIISGKTIQIQAKGADQVSARICCNAIGTTNNRAAIQKEANTGRRFAIFYMAQQTEEDMSRSGMNKDGPYFRDLFHWRDKEGGMAIIADMLHRYEIPEEFDPTRGAYRAPDTSTTSQVIEETLGPVEQQIQEAIRQGQQGFRGGWVSTVELARYLSAEKVGQRLTPRQRRAMLVKLGYIPHPGLAGAEGWTHNPVQPDGCKTQLYIRQGHETAALGRACEIAKAYEKAQVISPFERNT